MPSFLQSSFLAGLIALAVPVLIHLFFRLKTKRVELGTIRFLREVLEENARRRKVMRWLLLALRMAFVGLLVALFARPFLVASAASGDQELLVILIDQSATMQFKDEPGRLIDQAVAAANALIAQSGNNTTVEVAFFDHHVHPLAADSESDAASRRIGNLSAPANCFGATNFGAAFAWARDVCVKSPTGRKRLHLFTDLQRSGLDWSDVEPFPADVRAELHDLGRSVVNNLAVTEVRSPRLWVRPGEAPVVRAAVLHGGAFALPEVTIVLEVGRAAEKSRTMPLPFSTDHASQRHDFARLADRVTKRERVKLEPGATVTVEFELPPLAEGLWQGRVSIEYDDDLPFDNQRYFAISATPAYRVLVVHGGEKDTLVRETYFLEAALRLANEGEAFQDSPFAPTAFPYSDGAALPELSAFDAVALANVANVSRTDADALASFVRGGGGMVVFTGDRVTASSASALTQAGLAVGEVGDIQVTSDLPWRLTIWDEAHPIFEPFSDPQYGDLRRIMFAAYTKVAPAPDASVLATFHTGDAAVIEKAIGAGSLIWVTTSCGRDWSDWCHSRLFLPAVHQMLGYQVGLTAGGRARTRLVDEVAATQDLRSYPETVNTLGDRRNLLPRHRKMSQSLSVSGQPLNARQSGADRGPTIKAAPTPGVDHYERYVESVNISPRESETDRCSREEFEARFAVRFVDENSDPAMAATALPDGVQPRRDEIWHWIACVLLGVVLLEGFVGNRTPA